MSRSIPPGLLSLGFQTMTLSNSTAQGLNSTCQAAKAIIFSVETNAVRMRADGTDPTKNTGVLIRADEAYLIELGKSSTLKFQRSTGTAKVSIQALKYVGDV